MPTLDSLNHIWKKTVYWKSMLINDLSSKMTEVAN